MGGGGGG